VDDLGEACVFALEQWNPAAAHAPRDATGKQLTFLNVGTGVDLSIRELAEVMAQLIDFQGEIFWDASKPDGTLKKQLNVAAFAKLGWKARIELSEGLSNAVETYQRQKAVGSVGNH
jgi:GDP-L-fucose synthase